MTEVKRGRPAKIDQETDAAKGTTPGWKPSSLLGTLKARTGFTARWVSNDPGRIAKMRSEGWIVMKPTDNVGTFNADDVTASGSLSGEIRYRDTIAMMLPDNLKKSRSEYYAEENRETMKSVLKQSESDLRQKGVSTYTPKGQAGKIVID